MSAVRLPGLQHLLWSRVAVRCLPGSRHPPVPGRFRLRVPQRGVGKPREALAPSWIPLSRGPSDPRVYEMPALLQNAGTSGWPGGGLGGRDQLWAGLCADPLSLGFACLSPSGDRCGGCEGQVLTLHWLSLGQIGRAPCTYREGPPASEAVSAAPTPGLGPGLGKRASPAPTPTKPRPVLGRWGGRGQVVFGTDRGFGAEGVSPCVGWGLGWADGKGQALAYLSRRELLSGWRFAGSKPHSRGICD